MRACRARVVCAALVGAGLFPVAAASAHNLTITQVVVVLKTDGTYWIDMRADVDALALGVSSEVPSSVVAAALRAQPPDELSSTIEHAAGTVLHRVRIRFDHRKVMPVVTFPEYDHPMKAPGGEPSVLGTVVRLAGRYPEGATSFTFGASRAFGPVQLTILSEMTAGGAKHLLEAGDDSPPFSIQETKIEHGRFVLGQYLVLGFEHILPKGLDHILFILGLYLLSTRLRALLLQITAFTVAHTVTLALSMTGVAVLPSSIVEPLIAVSITYIAVENLCVREMKPWRPAVVFMFGLLHGMGFASVLRELGMPGGQFVSALVGFNAGVELGQIAVVAVAFLVLGWFRDRPWYRSRIICPISLAIALVGAYWAVQRVGLTL